MKRSHALCSKFTRPYTCYRRRGGIEIVEPMCAGLDFIMAGACVVWALPLVFRKVRMNLFYGARVRQAYFSEQAWFDLGEYKGKQLLLWSLFPALAGVASLSFPFKIAGQTAAQVLPPLLSFASFACVVWVPARRTTKYATRQYPGLSWGILAAVLAEGRYHREADEYGILKYTLLYMGLYIALLLLLLLLLNAFSEVVRLLVGR